MRGGHVERMVLVHIRSDSTDNHWWLTCGWTGKTIIDCYYIVSTGGKEFGSQGSLSQNGVEESKQLCR